MTPLEQLGIALLGGGVSGAIVAGLVSVYTQRKQHEREDRHRFTPYKREMYVKLLLAAREWVHALLQQRAIAYGVNRGENTTDEIPSLGKTGAIGEVAEEVGILAPSVANKAEALYMAVVELGAFSVDTKRKGLNVTGDIKQLSDAVMKYEHARVEFKSAAANDLGTAQPPRRSRLTVRFPRCRRE